jgi:hypothetical protein
MMRTTWNTIALPLAMSGLLAMSLASGCAKEVDTSACQACASNAAKVDAAAARAEAAANRAEAAAQRAEAAAQKAEAVFSKTVRK